MPLYSNISFRAFGENELPQLRAWFRATHVARWWTVSESDVTAKYLPRIRGEGDTRMFAIVVDGNLIGMIQAGPADDEYAVGSGACGIDFLIGDEGSIGRGLGPRIIDAFVTEEVFGHHGYLLCLSDPHEDNQRSIRALEKAGFVFQKRFHRNGVTHALLVRHHTESPSLQ